MRRFWRRVWQGSPGRPLARPAGPANPFEAYLLIACIVQGWSVLAHVAQPQAIAAVLPPPLRLLWAVLLLGGGTLSVSGLYWPNPFTGVEIKRVGLVMAGGGTLAYGLAVLAYGPAGYVAAASNLFFALACLVRFRQVTAGLRHARRRVEVLGELARGACDDAGAG